MRAAVDVHQHLWPPALIELLRSRTEAPQMVGWTLYLDGEPPFRVPPEDHDPGARAALEADSALAAVALSAPLGIEFLPPEQAEPLLAAWHGGARELPAPFAAWASPNLVEPDLDGLGKLLADDFVGVQLPATALGTPQDVESLAPLLAVVERADKPILVHPGPAPTQPTAGLPAWWAAVVEYPAQLQAAWWAWATAGRALLPNLRVCFVAGAGLAPVHHERYAARSGAAVQVDQDVFVDTSSYGRQAVDALTRILGIDAIVRGSDRPYAEPAEHQLGDAAAYAIDVTNPCRLLSGLDTPTPQHTTEGGR